MFKCNTECTFVFVTVCEVSSTIMTVTSTCIILYLVIQHLVNYTNPFFQNKIVGKNPNETEIQLETHQKTINKSARRLRVLFL